MIKGLTGKLLAVAFVATLVVVMSLLDTVTVGRLYGKVAQLFGIDLRGAGLQIEQISDYGHVAAGFLLTAFALKAFPARPLLTLLCLVFFLTICELLQGLTLSRQAGFDDLVRGGVGVFAGLLFSTIVQRSKTSRLKSR